MNKIEIPSYFQWYGNEIVIDEKLSFMEGIAQHPLYFDILADMDIQSIKPWEHSTHYIPLLFDQWSEAEGEIAHLFKNRNRQQALQPMQRMILSFIACLFWLNKCQVRGVTCLSQEIKTLSITPVNCSERVEYLLNVPNHHHSFAQLKQLFIEIQKKFAVVRRA